MMKQGSRITIALLFFHLIFKIMAQLHVQKKRNQLWWLWLIIVIIIIAVAYYMMVINNIIPDSFGIKQHTMIIIPARIYLSN